MRCGSAMISSSSIPTVGNAAESAPQASFALTKI